MPERAPILRLVLAIVSLAGCSALGPPVHTSLPPPPAPSTTCPFGFEGARVAIEDTALGADVRIVAYGDVAELRRCARDAAAMYGPGARRGLGHEGRHGSGLHHGLGLADIGLDVSAVEEDTDEGALIRVTAVHPADVAAVRARLAERAGRARVGDCP